MDEELIQKYYKSIKPTFIHIAYQTEDGKKNPVYWEVNLESFLSSVDEHLENHELLKDLKPIKKDFYRQFENMANEIFEVFERVFKYVKEKKEISAVNSISIHLIDLKNDLKHLKGMSTSIKYIALTNSKRAYQVKELFIYHIERFIGWISHESIYIMQSPLGEYFKDIYDSYNSAFDLSKIQIEAELSKIPNLERGIRSSNYDKKIKWRGSKIELIELLKALIENESIRGTQKEIFHQFSEFFDIELNYPDKTIQDIKNRNNGSETIFLDRLKATLYDYITKENIR